MLTDYALTGVLLFTAATTLLVAAPRATTEEFVNSLGMKMILVRPDQFLTGTMLDRSNWQWYEGNERPRWVTLSLPFFLAAHEVTNAQYRAFVKATGHPEPKGLLLRGRDMTWDFEPWKHPEFSGDNQPVVCVTAADAEAFCRWLSEKEGKSYSLPASDEWEYACRAGTGTDYNWGNDEIAPAMANFDPFLIEYVFGQQQPMMSLTQALRLRGGMLRRDRKTNQVRGQVRGRSFEITPGKVEAKVDGNLVRLEAAPVTKGRDILVSMSFLANDLDLAFTGHTAPVGSFRPNAWGFHDMHGNVNEITSTGGEFREVRGGGWNDSARRCRSPSRRDRWLSTKGMAGIGFRVKCGVPIAPKVEVTVGEPVVVKSGEPGLEYKCSELLQLRDGTLILQDRRSTDKGKTWHPCPLLPSQPTLELQDGSIISIPFNIPHDKERGNGWGRAQGLRSSDGWKTIEPFEITMYLPEAIGGFDDGGAYRDSVGWCDHGLLQLPNGEILLSMYGFFRNARVLSDYQRYPAETQQWKYVSWLVSSRDGGATWNYLSTTIYHPELTRGGGCEEGLVRLAEGSLLLGARTGEHGFPNERMLFTWSKDEGKTWSYPKALFVDDKPILGIYPQFVLMKSGVLAMVWGRTGYGSTCLAFSLDGRGETWSDLTPLPFDMGGYDDMVEVEPGMLLVTGSNRVNGQYDLRVVPVMVRM